MHTSARAWLVRKVHSANLTGREPAILEAVARGLTTAEIGSELSISEHTVKFHLTHIYRKLGVTNSTAAVRWAVENGLAGS